jgi:hypothetical protein
MIAFVNSFQSEWMKTRRSLALWMVVVGGFFTPTIIIVARLVNHASVPELYAHEDFWQQLWRSSWESMAVFFLPLGAILSTSLIAQIEYKNNTWKQLHTLPLSYTTIFLSKLAVILVLMAMFFALFNVGIWLSAVIPYLLIGGTPWPTRLPWQDFILDDLLYFVDCLPIVALQYLLALRFKNFLVGVGLGFVFWVGALGGVSWRFGYVLPYTYTILHYLKGAEKSRAVIPDENLEMLAAGWFIAIVVAAFVLYVTRSEKG